MQANQHKESYQKQLLGEKDKFETIFEQSGAASIIIAPDLTILKVNQALTMLLGFTAPEIEGTHMLNHACPEHLEHWQNLQKAMQNGHQAAFKIEETCLLKKDKSRVWVNVSTVLYHERDTIYYFTVLTDITSRRQIQQTERYLNVALQHANMAVWEMDLATRQVNRSGTHDYFFGYSQPLDDWTLESYSAHWLPEYKAAWETAISGLKTNISFEFEGRISAKGGAVKWLYFQGKVSQTEKNESRKLLGTIKDITKEKIAEKDKEEFISSVSHELRTPITSIKAQAQILERRFLGMDDKVTTLMLRRINLQVGRLNILIKDLLNTSRLDEQKLTLLKEEFWFNEMVGETVAEIQRTTAHQLIIKQNPPVLCAGDREKTSQVLSNLLTNAIKFSPSKNKVIINVEEKEGRIICSIQDFGIGIATNKQPHIFERFYRASGIQERVISGLGLGLYISSEIIEQLKGKIWLNSAPGKGSTFYFSIAIGKINY